jgi:hypothetical protein
MIGSGTRRVTQNSVGEGGVSYTDAREEIPERRSSLRPSEKELPELRPVTEISMDNGIIFIL